MNTNQARKIGETVSNLLLYVEREGLQPTISGIEVTEGNGNGDQVVSLYACRPNGYDYQARVTVNVDGHVLTNALVSQWDDDLDRMTSWEVQVLDGVTRGSIEQSMR